MDQSSLKHRYTFNIDALNSRSRADQVKDILKKSLEHAAGGQKVETDIEHRILTILSSESLDIAPIAVALQPYGFHLRELKDGADETNVLNVCIDGMTCQSCELLVERNWKKLSGVNRVEVQASTGKAKIAYHGTEPSMAQLQDALGEGKYIVSANGIGRKTKPSLLQIVGLFALVLVLGSIASRFGLLNTNFSVGSGMSFGAIFVIGLVAASSSCIAITGGLLLSSAAKFNERYGSANPMGRMRPVFLFVLGRIVAYTILGGLLGVLGGALAPSPLVTALIAIAAALYMIVMGLDMLQIAPVWLKGLTPKMPKALSRRVMDAEGKEHPLAPLGLGAATFFLPCGFTQALQLYALTTGSFSVGAVSLLAFALGTAPALLALGWASSSLKGKAGRFFFKFSGALVVVLGFWNIQNGLAIAGYPVSLPRLGASSSLAANPGAGAVSAPIQGNVQVIKMKVGDYGYEPNRFTIRAGVPVRWEVDASTAGGCLGVLVSRKLGIQKLLDQNAPNVIEFTPTVTGDVAFSCSMGMFRGSFTILPAA